MANSKQFILNLFPDNSNNEITAADMRTFVTAIFDEEIDINEIQDNLISIANDKPLSANQGRILDTKITDTNTLVDTKEDSLGLGAQDQVLQIENGLKVWKDVPVFTETVVVDSLASTSAVDALSAKQGNILDTRVSQNTGDVIALDTRVTTNEASVTTNAGDVTALNTRVTNSELATTVNTGNISSNLAIINNNVANISANSADIVLIDGKITTNTANISTNATNIATNVTNIATNVAAISAIDTRVTTNEGDFAALDASTTVAIGNISGRVDLAEISIATNVFDINAIDTRVTATEAQTATNVTNIGTNITNIATNVAAIGAIDTRVTANEVQTATNVTNISSLGVRVTANESTFALITADVLANTTAIATNTSSIVSLSIDVASSLADTLANTTGVASNLAAINVLDGRADTNDITVENNRQNIIRVEGITTVNAGDITGINNQITLINGALDEKEDGLGLPPVDGYVIGSDIFGNREWYPNAFNESFIVIDNLNAVGDIENALTANQGYILDQFIKTKEDSILTPLSIMPPLQSEGTLVLTAKITDPIEVGGRVVGYTYDWQESGIGTIANLGTTDKTSIVNAINEINVIVGDSSHGHTNKAILDATTASYVVADKTKVDFVSVTQAVDLDIIEIDTNTNTTAIGAIDTRVTANEVQTATNVINIATNVTNIATNVFDINAIDTRVTATEAQTATNVTNILTNLSSIGTNATNIATNSGNIATNTTDIGSLNTRVTTNEVDIANKENLLPIDTGYAGYVLATDGFGARSWILQSPQPEIYENFTDLLDTPGSYLGHASRVLSVNATETGVSFETIDRSVLDITSSESAGFLLNTDPKLWSINDATFAELDYKMIDNAPLVTLPPVQSAGTLFLTASIVNGADDGFGRVLDYNYDWQESGIGTLSTLTTTVKTDLVSAINEVQVEAHSHTNKAILDATTASYVVADKTKVDYITVTAAVNLDSVSNDLANKAEKTQNVATSTVYVDNTTGLNYKIYVDNGQIVLEELA